MTSPTPEVLMLRLESLAADMTDIKVSIKAMEGSVSTLVRQMAVIEERQVSDRATLRTAMGEITELRKRVGDLEAAQPMQRQSADWVQRAVWAVTAAALTALLSGVLRTGSVSLPTHGTPAVIERKQGRDE